MPVKRLILLLLLASPLWTSSPTWVKKVCSASPGPASSTTISCSGSPTTVGDLIVVHAGQASGSGNVSTSAADTHNSYSSSGPHCAYGSGDKNQYSQFYGIAATTSSETFTVTWGSAVTYRNIVVEEFTGNPAVGALDTGGSSTNCATGSGTGGIDTNVTTSNANELIVCGAALDHTSETYTLGSGYSNLDTITTNGVSLGAESRGAATAGAYATGLTWNATSTWAGGCASYIALPAYDYTCTGPSSGLDWQASTNFTCTKTSGTWGSGNTVTIGDGSHGGTITPSVGSGGTSPVTTGNLNGLSSFTYTYTPVTVATISLGYTDNYSGVDSVADSYVVSALVLTFSGCPSSGYVSVASSSCTVALSSGVFNGSMTVTVADGTQGGTVTPSVGSPGTTPKTVTPTASSSSFTFTYTPASTGVKTISLTNNFNGTNPSSFGYTSNAATLAFSGCSSGYLRVASSTCTVTITGATFDGTHTVTLSDGGNLGTFTSGGNSAQNSLTVTPTNGASTFTFTYTPYLVGVKSISGTTSTANWGTPTPFLYTSSRNGDACTMTAKADGNWASAATWTPSGGGCARTTPDTGDTVVMTGYHVTIPVSTTAYMGSCPADNATYDLQISDNAGVASGRLEIAGKLWLCGNRSLTAGTHSLGDNPTTWPILQLDTGGELDFDNNQNASVAYRTVSGADYGWGKLYAGTSTDTCNFAAGTCPTTIKSVNLGAVNPDLFEATRQDSLVYRIYGTLLSDCGSASKGCLEYKTGNGSASNNYADAGVTDLRGNIFQRTGTFQSPVSGVYGVVPSMNVLGNRFLNDLAGFESLDAVDNQAYSKACTFTGNYFSAVVGQSNVPMGGCAWTGNTFAGAFAGGNGVHPFGSFTDNVIVEPPGETNMSSPIAARNIWMKQATGGVGSTHTMAGPASNVWKATENICLAIGSETEGHCINFNTMISGGPWTMLNNISLPATGNGANSGQFLTYDATGTLPTVYFDHNGMFGSATYNWGISLGHGASVPSNQVVESYRANVHYSAAGGMANWPIGYSASTDATVPGNPVVPANMGWNAMYNQTTSMHFGTGVNSNCNPSIFYNTSYYICEASGSAPANDFLSTDPKVIDNTRNPFTWASRVHGGTASEAGMEAVLAACQDETWCIEEMRTWIARGFQPTNLALKGKAHDGRIVGFTGTYGSGYTGNCTVTFTPQDAADLGTGAAATCTFASGVPVIQITNPGANYRIATPAAVTIGGTCGGGCTAASLTPVISPHDIGPVQMALIPGAM